MVLGITGLLSYGLLMPWLGFYWDDWAKISVSRLFGSSGYWAYYAEDRPLSAWTHILFTPILGTSPFPWQIFQFGLIVLTAWGLYWSLTRLWPQARWQDLAAALIFIVYPAFTQRAAAVTFHQQWLQFSLYFLSLGCMLTAARLKDQPGRFWGLTGLAVVFSIAQLTVTEYFAPLELLRPLLLWLLLGQESPQPITQRLRRTLWLWSPYLLVTGGYVLWRFFFLNLSGSDPYQVVIINQLIHNPFPTLLNLLKVALQDSLHILVSVWGPLLVIEGINQILPFQLIALLMSAASAGLAAFFLLNFETHPPHSSIETFSFKQQALIVGLAAFVLGVLPAWATGRQVVFDFHSDRYALPALFGASLIWVVLIDWLTPARLQRAILVAGLVGLGAGLQLRNSNEYRWLWQTETRFFWQLYWRAPEIQAGTAILTYDEIFPNQGLFSSSSALNLLYPPKLKSDNGLAYWWYTLSPRYDINRLSDPLELSFHSRFRSLQFDGSTPNTLLLQYDPSQGNCLWIITPEDQAEPGLKPLTKAMSSITNLARIEPQPVDGWQPPQELFGPEPAHDWCYFYEKAELARQQADWEKAAELGDQAQALGYSPSDSRSGTPHEWLPFIEAYAHLGKWEQAAQLSLAAEQRGKEFQPVISQLWDKLAKTTSEDAAKKEAVQSVIDSLKH